MRRHALLPALLLTACNGTPEASCPEEPVNATITIEHIGEAYRFSDAGSFDTPDGASAVGPIGPGDSYVFTFEAAPGSHLQLASMYVQSNDWMLGGPAAGLPLWSEDGTPLTGERNTELTLWDAGTEIDQTIGEGADQAPRQSAADTGEADPTTGLRTTTTGFDAVTDWASLDLQLGDDGVWTATLSNTAPADHITVTAGTVDVLLSPGAFAVHPPFDQLFESGDDASAAWEALAEDGDPSALATELDDAVGVVVPLASPFWVLSTREFELYETGQAASAELEPLAEDGNASSLDESYTSLVETEDGADIIDFGRVQQPAEQEDYEPAPALPGQSFEIDLSVSPVPGALFHAVWMYAQSNDVFFGLADTGVELIDDECQLVTGELSTSLWDAGTEVNQRPGFGADQAPRQSGANTGEDEGGTVQPVDDGFEYGDPSDIVLITVQ